MPWSPEEMIFALYAYLVKKTQPFDYNDELICIRRVIQNRFNINRTTFAINSKALRFYEIARYYRCYGTLNGFVCRNSSQRQIDIWRRVIIDEEYGIYNWDDEYSVVDFGTFLETQLFPAN